jgi:uncharacterized protein
MPKTMSAETITAVVNRLGDLYLEQANGFAIVLHGGEPLLLGHDRLSCLLRGLRERLPDWCRISIQTNGTLITNELLDVCSSTRTTLGVSLDGPQEVNDRHRRGFQHESTYEQTLAGIRKLQSHADSDFLFTGILSVIDPQSDPHRVYTFFKEIGVPSVNFLLSDGNHSKLPSGKASFESTEYGEWLVGLWETYTSDDDPIRIESLDIVAKLLLGGRSPTEGMGTSDYAIAIIDTDGSITKNDTLKSSYDGADRFERAWSVFTHSLYEITKTSEFRGYLQFQIPTSPICAACPVATVCGGGMPLYRWKDGSGYDNPSVYCNDHKQLISRIGQDILAATQCPVS